MNYGLYLSANGVLSSLHRQDVLANNLANVETIGFKPDVVIDRERLPERIESGAPVDPRLMLERLGGGHHVAPTMIRFAQGGLERTDNPFDLAIEGDGLFVVSTQDGAAQRLTRDGRFTRADDGTLVTSIGGHPVLDADGRSIRLQDRGPIDVDRDGTIRQSGRAVARIALVSAEPGQLVKEGSTLLRDAGSAPGLRPAAGGELRQGFVEASAVDPIMTLHHLVSASKSAQANAKLMQYHDFIMGQAISTFGRVA
ncbi:MAG: flagellar hook-basal body protein [Planctomycetota bacterium]|jgi:flagellar basal body rod protein FlgG